MINNNLTIKQGSQIATIVCAPIIMPVIVAIKNIFEFNHQFGMFVLIGYSIISTIISIRIYFIVEWLRNNIKFMPEK